MADYDNLPNTKNVMISVADKSDSDNFEAGDKYKWIDSELLKSIIDPITSENVALKNLMKSLGWIRNPSKFIIYGTGKTINTSETTYYRVNELGDIESHTFAGVVGQPFRVVDRNGYVDTGLNGDDLTTPQVHVSTLWGYDKSGTLSSIIGARSDSNDGVPYRYYQHPINGDIILLLPQFVETAVGSVENYSLMRGVVKPSILDDYIYLGYALLDENAPAFAYVFNDMLNQDNGL